MFFVFKGIGMALEQCLPVLPTNPIHTLDRQNTGVKPTRQLHRGIEPHPYKQETWKQTGKERTDKNLGQQEKHKLFQSNDERWAQKRGTCQQTNPIRIGSPPICNQNKPRPKTTTTKQSKLNEQSPNST